MCVHMCEKGVLALEGVVVLQGVFVAEGVFIAEGVLVLAGVVLPWSRAFVFFATISPFCCSSGGAGLACLS